MKGRAAGRAERIYGRLLRAYPPAFRARFGRGMRFAFARQLDEARRRGRLAGGVFWLRTAVQCGVLGLVERLRGAFPAPRLGHPGAELRQAVRRLLRAPGFAVAAVLTLALGIGASTAIFSIVHGVVLAPLPYPEPERLVWIGHAAPGAGVDVMGTSLGAFVHYRDRARSLEGIALYQRTAVNLTDDGEATRVVAARVTGRFFDVLLDGRPLHLGRPIGPGDDGPDAPPVAVLSHGLWQQGFGADRGVLGSTLQVDGVTAEVVGVAPPDVALPDPDTALWLPRQFDPATVILGNFAHEGLARLRPGATVEEARSELRALVPTFEERFPSPAFDLLVTGGELTPLVRTLQDRLVGDVAALLWILLGTVGFVLSLACANVANLFLVRAEGRRREVAVRRALGASDRHVLVHFLAESLVLAVAGGAAGLGLAAAGVDALVRWAPDSIPRLHEVGFSGPVLAAAAAITLAAALAFGVLPGLQRGDGARPDEDGRATAGRGRQRARDVLVVAQVALALLLMVGAGLMVRSFRHLARVDPGFDAGEALTFRVALPRASYPDDDAAAALQQRLLEGLRALPGTGAAGAITCLPLTGCGSQNMVYADDVPADPADTPPVVEIRFVTGDWFRAMGVPLLEGRGITLADQQQRRPTAVVSRNLAERLWPGEAPLGKGIHPDLPDEEPFRVVGVAGNVRSDLAQDEAETVYLSLLGSYPYMGSPHTLSFVVRSEGPALALAEPVRRLLRGLDPTIALADVSTVDRLRDAAGAPTAFAMFLFLVAGAVALALGAVGVYGVLSYRIGQRTGEIGVRMALGAAARDVQLMVLRQGVSLTVVGVAAGLVGSLGLTRLMATLLFGVSPGDPVTYAAVVVALVGVAAAACWLPARRAARVDPVEALRRG